MKIAIVGAGPAGCHLAHLLADTEHEILLFDHRVRPPQEAGYEKPCGGGLSPIVGRRFPDVMALPFPRHRPPRVMLRASDGSQVEHELDSSDWAIVSRADFGRALLERALSNNHVRHIRQKVTDVERSGEGWSVRTASGETFSADFLVGADGVRSIVRQRVVGPIPRQHLGLAVGYRVRGAPDAIVFQTFADMEGYLWSFPRATTPAWAFSAAWARACLRNCGNGWIGSSPRHAQRPRRKSAGLACCRWPRIRACGTHPAPGRDGPCWGMRRATCIPSPARASPTLCGRRSCWPRRSGREIHRSTKACGGSSMATY